jgi:hypothetical protein
MSIGSLVGSLTGGLLGGPELKPQKAAEAQKTNIDPNRAAGISAAKKAKMAAAGAVGRPDLRIDLAGTDDLAGRSGIRIA